MNGLARLLLRRAAGRHRDGRRDERARCNLQQRRPGRQPGVAEGSGEPVRGPRHRAAPPACLQLERRRARSIPRWCRSRSVQVSAGGELWVARLYLIIDANPRRFPASSASRRRAAAPRSRRACASTPTRTCAPSPKPATASFYGVTRFVKASGGCSAPPGSDARPRSPRWAGCACASTATPGARRPCWRTLMIDHPNHSGLAMDQYTRQFTPAHYVRKVEVSYAGKPVFSADVDFDEREPELPLLVPAATRAAAPANCAPRWSTRRTCASSPRRAARQSEMSGFADPARRLRPRRSRCPARRTVRLHHQPGQPRRLGDRPRARQGGGHRAGGPLAGRGGGLQPQPGKVFVSNPTAAPSRSSACASSGRRPRCPAGSGRWASTPSPGRPVLVADWYRKRLLVLDAAPRARRRSRSAARPPSVAGPTAAPSTSPSATTTASQWSTSPNRRVSARVKVGTTPSRCCSTRRAGGFSRSTC